MGGVGRDNENAFCSSDQVDALEGSRLRGRAASSDMRHVSDLRFVVLLSTEL